MLELLKKEFDDPQSSLSLAIKTMQLTALLEIHVLGASGEYEGADGGALGDVFLATLATCGSTYASACASELGDSVPPSACASCCASSAQSCAGGDSRLASACVESTPPPRVGSARLIRPSSARRPPSARRRASPAGHPALVGAYDY